MFLARLTRLAVVSSTAVLAACASVSAGADFDPAIRLDQYHSFDWGAGDTMPAGDVRLDNNPFFDSRVRAAVELEMAAKGVQRRTTSPDLLVHYHVSVRQRVDVVRTDEARGYTDPWMRQGSTVVEFDEGTLLLDVADARTKKIVWRGWSQTDVTGLLDNPREMEKRVSESIRRMLSRYPQAGPAGAQP
ncbi:MAG: DUF4136 domain-containing protein [Gemmatimonadaceae bacterium]|nr:DUF4136 domain-containing protein [Gemmatimonadaceae bacterium]